MTDEEEQTGERRLGREDVHMIIENQFQAYDNIQSAARSVLSITAAGSAAAIGFASLGVIPVPELQSGDLLNILKGLIAPNPTILYFYTVTQAIVFLTLVIGLIGLVSIEYINLFKISFGTGILVMIYGSEVPPDFDLSEQKHMKTEEYENWIAAGKSELSRANNRYRHAVYAFSASYIALLLLLLFSAKYFYSDREILVIEAVIVVVSVGFFLSWSRTKLESVSQAFTHHQTTIQRRMNDLPENSIAAVQYAVWEFVTGFSRHLFWLSKKGLKILHDVAEPSFDPNERPRQGHNVVEDFLRFIFSIVGATAVLYSIIYTAVVAS